MAQWLTYKCKKCGYKVQTEPRGYYALMSGMFYNFKCSNCKSIVTIPSGGLSRDGELPKCPNCNETSGLSTWNPIEGHCPKCDGEMEVDRLYGVIMAD